MRSRVAMAVAAITLLAACNGDDVTEPTTTTAVPVEETTTSSAQPTTTTAPEEETTTTTTAETSTTQEESTTTSAVPTTDPTTTADPDDYAAQAESIFAQVEGGWLTSVQLARDPSNDELRAQLDAYFTGGQLEGRRNVNDRYRTENLYEVENPDEPDSIDVDPASFAMNEARTFATVQACEVTSGIIYEIGGNPDGSDALIEDGIDRSVIVYELTPVDGVWKVESGRRPDDGERIAACE